MALNVLIVDDSAVMRQMLLRTLRLTGVHCAAVHEAEDGQQALQVLQRAWIDLALIDLNMPVMDGEALIGAIRQSPLYGELPIIVVSTESSPVRVERVSRNVTAFVRKPFTAECLRHAVREITGVEPDSDSAAGCDLDVELSCELPRALRSRP